MTEQAAGRRLPAWPALIAGGLVILGVLLWMFVGKGFLFVAGLGAFGPGILRELGWLEDQDEFQRQAAHRAGYHAYLIGGLATALIVSGLRWRETTPGDSSEWIMLILVVLWMTWLFSALLAYWGAAKTASRVLMTFGSFWAVFVLAALIGEASMPESPADVLMSLLGVLVGIVVVAPFFVLARTAPRWPRRTGLTLLGISALFLVVFAPRGALPPATELLTLTLLVVPLGGCGVALVRDARTAR